MTPGLLFFQGAGTLLSWTNVALEYLAFLPYFGIFGALGFHFLVLPRRAVQVPDETGSVFLSADRGAARIGLAGSLLILISFVANATKGAGSQHLGIIDALLRAGPRPHVRAAFGLLLLITFAFAARRIRGAWAGAGLIAVAFALRDIVTGQWSRLVNPLHEVAASLWLGTLFVIVIVGLPAILRSGATGDRRRSLVGALITRFSPLALVGTALLGLTGVVTSWLHLKYLAALWTTPYGYALDAKLGVVLIVVALGGWNWRRIMPKLAAEETTSALRRSSIIELVFAGIVLLLTAVLVSLPTPKLPAPLASVPKSDSQVHR